MEEVVSANPIGELSRVRTNRVAVLISHSSSSQVRVWPRAVIQPINWRISRQSCYTSQSATLRFSEKNIFPAREIPAGSIDPTFFYILPPWRSPWAAAGGGHLFESTFFSHPRLPLRFLSLFLFFCVLMGSRKVQEN